MTSVGARVGVALLGCVALGVFLPTQVRAASLERLVMPGPLIEDHADLEDDCDACHRAFVPGEQATLCLDCHEEIRDDVDAGRGFHGHVYRAAPQEACKTCHTEHKGRDADVVGLNRGAFDHARTDFPLVGAHVGRDCAACHQAEAAFREAPSACVACHGDQEPHQGRLGDDCASCHSEDRPWQEVRFDHALTAFPLRGAHERATCGACHVDEVWNGLRTACSTCHRADDVHRGARGDDCGNCHDASSWKSARFDHLEVTGFALRGRHGELACSACHLEQMSVKEPPTACIGCHSVDDPHRGRFGTGCAQCHGESTWKVRYDHERETGYALVGAHGELACEQCHRGALEDPLPATCVGCHEDDDPHGGRYRSCGDCHAQTTWHTVAFDHAFTAFPLVGIHASAACEACHVSLEFTDVATACGDCHAARDAHEGAFGADCGRCHNPNGWNRWQFDHDAQTEYPLTGRHRGLECALCHESALPEGERLPTRCFGCHRSDDAHDGRFGTDCGRCHTTESFSDPLLWER